MSRGVVRSAATVMSTATVMSQIFSWVQPAVGLQLSLVQALLSSQLQVVQLVAPPSEKVPVAQSEQLDDPAAENFPAGHGMH